MTKIARSASKRNFLIYQGVVFISASQLAFGDVVNGRKYIQHELSVSTYWNNQLNNGKGGLSPLELLQRLEVLVPRPLRRVFNLDMESCPNCGG